MAEQLRVLLAGCGDVGSRLARMLLANGHQVWGVRRQVGLLPAGVQPVMADLSDPSVPAAWPQDLDYVVYCAAAGRRGEEVYRKTYLNGLENVLSWLEGSAPQKIFFTSSTAVYRQDGGEWVDELSPAEPDTMSGQIMLAAENLLMTAACPTTSIRFGGIYGPGRSYLLERVKEGNVYPQNPIVYGNRIHTDDCAGFLFELIQHDNVGQALDDVYLAVDSNPAPMSEVTNWLARQMGVSGMPVTDLPARSSKRCCNDRMLATGYQLRYPGYRDGYNCFL